MDCGAGLAPEPLKTPNRTTAEEISVTGGGIFNTPGQQSQGKPSMDSADVLQVFTARIVLIQT